MGRRSGTVLVALSAAIVLSACGAPGSSSSATSPSPSPSPVHYAAITDACTLVTNDEANAAVGSNLMNLTAQAGVAIPGICFYGNTTGQNIGVYIYAQTYPDATTADQVNPNQLAAAFGGQMGVNGSAKVVNGIGDKAVEYTATQAQGSGVALFVFKGNAVIMIIVVPSTDGSKAEHLATLAIGRLTPG